jgi:hypothetical protein
VWPHLPSDEREERHRRRGHYRNFNAAMHALSGLKLLEHTPGRPRFIAAFGGTVVVTVGLARLQLVTA